MRTVVLRAVSLFTAVAMAGGCATDRSGVVAQATGMILTGRVVSASEVTGMTGDIAVVWSSYRVAPQDGSGPQVVVIDAGRDCPVTGAGADVYRFELQRQRRVFGVTSESDRASFSDLFVVSCERLPSGSAA